MRIDDIKQLLIDSYECDENILDEYFRHIIDNQDDDSKYGENHHILPKSMFREFSDFNTCPWNKCRLSKSNHIIAHWLLAKATNDVKAMCAVSRTMNMKLSDIRNLSDNEIKDISEIRDDFWQTYRGENHHMYGQKRSRSTIEKQRKSIVKTLKTEQSIKRKSIASKSHRCSEEGRKLQSDISKAMWSDDDFKEKMSEIHQTAWSNDERRANASSKSLDMWSDDDFKEKMSEIQRESWNDTYKRETRLFNRRKKYIVYYHPHKKKLFDLWIENAKIDSRKRFATIVRKKYPELDCGGLSGLHDDFMKYGYIEPIDLYYKESEI